MLSLYLHVFLLKTEGLTNCAKRWARAHSAAFVKHMLGICGTYQPVNVCRHSHIGWSCHLVWMWAWVALSFSISQLFFQVVGTRVLQRMGTARERMPDTYVPEHQDVSVLLNLLSHLLRLCPIKLSAKATSPARKKRCVSGPMNAAVAMDTSELAVTLVRMRFCYMASTQMTCCWCFLSCCSSTIGTEYICCWHSTQNH